MKSKLLLMVLPLAMFCGCVGLRYQAFTLHEETESEATTTVGTAGSTVETSHENVTSRRVLVDGKTGRLYYFDSDGGFSTYYPPEEE